MLSSTKEHRILLTSHLHIGWQHSYSASSGHIGSVMVDSSQDSVSTFVVFDAVGSDVITYAAVDLGLPTGECVFSVVNPPEATELGFIESDGPIVTVREGLGSDVTAPAADGVSVPCGDDPEVRVSVIVGLGAEVFASAAEGLKVEG